MSLTLQVMGSKGMLGQAVTRAAAAAGHTVLPYEGGLEFITAGRLEPNAIVINCAGVTKQRGGQFLNSSFVQANALGPHRLQEAAAIMGTRVIHVSTDCVFQGKGPHDEDDVPDATDIYARSKLLGEIISNGNVTLRTSFVGFGARGLIHDMQTKEAISVSRNLLWTGHTVDTVAQTLIWIAEHPHIVGLVHMPGEEQNRYTLARDLKARWKLPARLDRDDGFVADRRLISGKWSYFGMPTILKFEHQLDTMWGPS